MLISSNIIRNRKSTNHLHEVQILEQINSRGTMISSSKLKSIDFDRRTPEVLWAQRSSKVYLTVALPDAKDVSVNCKPHGSFMFSATGKQGEKYDCTLELYGPIVPEGCKFKIGLRNILCSIKKEQKSWWKRLLKLEGKPAPYLKVDWSKWCDEDESDYDSASEDENTCNDDEESDDDGLLYIPDLEKARKKMN